MFKPVGDKIVLKKITETGQTSGGVIIPDTTQEGTLMGEVVAVGPGRILENGERSEMQCIIGDKIIYPKFGAKELEINNEDYLIIRENEILTIILEEK